MEEEAIIIDSTTASKMIMSNVPSPPPTLVFAYYVTGHGFGHATRVVEVRSSAPLQPNYSIIYLTLL